MLDVVTRDHEVQLAVLKHVQVVAGSADVSLAHSSTDTAIPSLLATRSQIYADAIVMGLAMTAAHIDALAEFAVGQKRHSLGMVFIAFGNGWRLGQRISEEKTLFARHDRTGLFDEGQQLAHMV